MADEIQADLALLYRTLILLRADTYVGNDVFAVGMHVLQKMARHKSLEVGMTWADMQDVCITLGKEFLCAGAPRGRLAMYAALQGLQRYSGLISGLAQADLAATPDYPLEPPPHVTQRPDVESTVIGDNTLILFRFVRGWAADPDALEEQMQSYPTKRLPAWVAKSVSKGSEIGNHAA